MPAIAALFIVKQSHCKTEHLTFLKKVLRRETLQAGHARGSNSEQLCYCQGSDTVDVE